MSEFILYSYFRSSASFRVRIALNVKEIAYEYRAIHLLNNGGEQHSGEYAKLNPSREVPALIHNGKAIAQSIAIIDYLDRVHPEKTLFPRDLYQRALVLQACEVINSGAQPLHNLRVLKALGEKFGATEEQKNAWAAQWIDYGLEAFDGIVKSHAGKFCFGDEVTAADCFLVPHLFNADRFKVSLEKYSTLHRLKENLFSLEAVKTAAPDSQPDFPKS